LVWVAPLQETVPPADARGDHLPRVKHKAVTCLEDFEFLSIERVGTGDKNSGHREVVLGDREPPAVSELGCAWKRPRTFTSSSLKA
jgi:hypothetical protein